MFHLPDTALLHECLAGPMYRSVTFVHNGSLSVSDEAYLCFLFIASLSY